MVEREASSKMAIRESQVVNLSVLYVIVITRFPLAGRSELIRSTCKSCRVCGGRIVYSRHLWGGEIYPAKNSKPPQKKFT